MTVGDPPSEGAAGARMRRVRQAPAAFQLDLADRRLTLALATLLVGLMTVQILGPISNVMQLGIIGLLALVHWRSTLTNIPRVWLFLAYPALTVASTYWSSAPDVTFRYAFQFALTAFGALVVASALGPRQFLVAIFLANMLVAVGSVFTPRYGMSMEGPVLIGLTGSKNQIALVSQLTLASGAAIFVDKTQHRVLRGMTLVAAAIALMLLIQAKSATGILTALGCTAAFLGLMFIRRFPAPIRVGAVLAGLVIVLPVVAMKDAVVEQAQHISATVFKKDPTLTGRTYLWAQADRLIDQRPVIGHGYRSIWLGKSVTTTGLLRWASLTDGRGFNFHNTYKEVTVDTGFAGLILFIGSMGLAGFVLLMRFLREGTVFWAFFFATYLTFLARSFAELVIGPFVAGALILFCIACYSTLKVPPERPEGAA